MDTPESMHSETKMHKQKEYFGIINATLVFMIAHSTQGMFYTNVDVQPIQTKKNHKKIPFSSGTEQNKQKLVETFLPKSQRSSIFEGSRLGKEGREGGNAHCKIHNPRNV